MLARYILAALAVVFIALGVRARRHKTMQGHVQSRTWLIIGLIFAVVSLWLWS